MPGNEFANAWGLREYADTDIGRLYLWLSMRNGAADLLAVYQRALQNDPQLREAEANRLAALESKPQALVGLAAAADGKRHRHQGERDTGSTNTVESVTRAGRQPQSFLESFPFNGASR